MTRARAARPPLVAALAALALALAACGGGSSSTSTSSGPTHAQYVASANAICATAHRQTGPLIAKLKSAAASLLTGGAAAVAATVTRLHDAAAANLAKLRALAQPPPDQARIGRMLRPLARVITLVGAAARDLAKSEALNALALIQQAQPLAAQVGTAARSLGASQCALVLAALA
jgi:hypothetical protein